MEKINVQSLGHRIHIIDGYDLGVPNRTGSYVIQEDELTIIETGASPSIPYLVKGLEELNLRLEDVKYVIATHIHLDHSGGAGLLLEKCPNAKMVVHPRAARHIIDPSRLIQGAKAVYGDDFDRYFNPILPIAKERVIIKEDRETLQIGKDCTLTFFDSPGHCLHHFSIYDPVSNGIFTGDTLGIRYEALSHIPLFLPVTSPNQFDPEQMLASIDLVESLNVERVFFGHFSSTTEVEELYKQLRQWLPIFMEKGEAAYREGRDHLSLSRDLLQILDEKVLNKYEIGSDDPIRVLLKLDMEVSSMGILDYLAKKNQAD